MRFSFGKLDVIDESLRNSSVEKLLRTIKEIYGEMCAKTVFPEYCFRIIVKVLFFCSLVTNV